MTNDQTPQEWLEDQFEFHLCDECGGDADEHEVGIVLGNYFAWCIKPHPDDKD